MALTFGPHAQARDVVILIRLQHLETDFRSEQPEIDRKRRTRCCRRKAYSTFSVAGMDDQAIAVGI